MSFLSGYFGLTIILTTNLVSDNIHKICEIYHKELNGKL